MNSLFPIAYAALDANAFGKVVDPIIQHVVNPIVMLVFAVALLVFAYGIIEMVAKGGDATAREAGKQHMMYGIIGIFIMMSAWGIIYLIANTIKQI